MIPVVFSSPLPIANQQAQQLQTPPASGPPQTQTHTSSTSQSPPSSGSTPSTSAVRESTSVAAHTTAEMLTTTPVTSNPTPTWEPWLDPALQASPSQTADSYMHVPVSSTSQPGSYMQIPVSSTAPPNSTGESYQYTTGSSAVPVDSMLDPAAHSFASSTQNQQYFQGNEYFPPSTQHTPDADVSGQARQAQMPPASTGPSQQDHTPQTTRY